MKNIKQDKINFEIINKNSRGITMIKEDTNCNTSIVSVLDLSDEVITSYEFDKVKLRYKSKYLNWQNLDCCGGWMYSKEELINQLKNDKKPFGNVVLNLYKNIDAHLLPLIEECSKIAGLRVVEIEHWNENCREFIIMKEGSLNKYIDLDEVIKDYYALGLGELSPEAYYDLKEFLYRDMIEYITKDNILEYDFANPNSTLELIFTGLLLGYPIESTADRIGLPFI
ncbi:MAG: hypothetical protein IJ086_15850 [Clostridium sp.]|nr:hypothetical protein [Clostridium sp.]MBQ9000148.1 hypothetical protein [Clostridium sp.]